jgi:hypothetical protein
VWAFACTRSILLCGSITVEWHLPCCTPHDACCPSACSATLVADRTLHVAEYVLHIARRLVSHFAVCMSCDKPRMPSSMGTPGVAFAERAAHCTRAQGQGGGGVIRMYKGAVLFDGVTISGTEAQVRAGAQRRVLGPMRVGGAGRRLYEAASAVCRAAAAAWFS